VGAEAHRPQVAAHKPGVADNAGRLAYGDHTIPGHDTPFRTHGHRAGTPLLVEPRDQIGRLS